MQKRGKKKILVPQFSTFAFYLCTVNNKTKVIMWIAVIISVSLAVEILSYLTGGEAKVGNGTKIQADQEIM